MTVEIDLAGGGTVLAWPGTTGVFFERFNGNHDPVGTPIEVVAGGSTVVSGKALADGGFSIIWDNSAGASAMAQDYDANGAAIGAPYAVASPPAAQTGSTSLAATSSNASDGTNQSNIILPNGDSVAASYTSVGGAWLEQIQQLDATGHTVGPVFSEQPGLASAYGDNQAAALANGGYVVGVLHQSSWNSELDVERFAADGTHLGSIAVAKLAFTGDFTYFPEVLTQSVAGLPDGGFVVSWIAQNNAPPQVFSQEFSAAGTAVGALHTLGAAAESSSSYTAPEIDAFANGQYTISWNSPSGTQSDTFSEQGAPIVSQGGGGGTGSGVVYDSAAKYTVPSGVTDVVLTGTGPQLVKANTLGDTITSNNYGSTLHGNTGNDTLIAGLGADHLISGGGNDTFVFNNLPTSAGEITGFNAKHDVLDLSGIAHAIGYTGSNPVADGYLQFVNDGAGNTKVYVDPHGPATTTPVLVTTIEHMLPSAIHAGDYLFA